MNGESLIDSFIFTIHYLQQLQFIIPITITIYHYSDS